MVGRRFPPQLDEILPKFNQQLYNGSFTTGSYLPLTLIFDHSTIIIVRLICYFTFPRAQM